MHYNTPTTAWNYSHLNQLHLVDSLVSSRVDYCILELLRKQSDHELESENKLQSLLSQSTQSIVIGVYTAEYLWYNQKVFFAVSVKYMRSKLPKY